MPTDTGDIPDDSQPKGGKVRLLALESIDGRTKAGQFVRDTRYAVMADLGGEDELSVLERIAVDNTVLLAAMVRDVSARWLLGEPVDPGIISTLANSFNRTADKIGWKRRPKNSEAFATYLERRRSSVAA